MKDTKFLTFFTQALPEMTAIVKEQGYRVYTSSDGLTVATFKSGTAKYEEFTRFRTIEDANKAITRFVERMKEIEEWKTKNKGFSSYKKSGMVILKLTY